MRRRTLKLVYFAILAIVTVSCAKEEDESANSIQKRILDAYVEVNYPQGLETTKSGIKIISSVAGTGIQPEKYDAVYLKISTKDLAGNYLTTNSADLAKELGTYTKSNYYGPTLYTLGYGTTILGLEELLYSMKQGGKISAIIPPWTTNYEFSTGTYANQTNVIYEFELVTVIEDMNKYQEDQLGYYSFKNFNGMDTVANGFYFKKLYEPEPKDTISSGDEIKVRYVGKLLDGFVFDTNIRDSAKKYGIYNSSNEYSALNITYQKTATEIKDVNEIVEGFAMAIERMYYGEQAVAFFKSDLGYGSESSGQIGPYQPLVFYVYIEPKDEE